MKVEKILRVSLQGVSRPFVCADEAGVVRWCKGNHTGLRACICEWLCGRFAAALGLPVPACDILRLDRRTFEDWRAVQPIPIPEIVTAANQYVFASTNVEEVKDVFDAEKELAHVDPLTLGRVYMFDRFFGNTDRTDANSNLLVSGSAYIIDHNNAFDPEFDEGTFAAEHILRRRYAAMSAEARDGFERAIRATVTREAVAARWRELPAEWTDPLEDVFTLESVNDYLFGGGRER